MFQNQSATTDCAGKLKISEEVISTIAAQAALEVEGVSSCASGNTNIKNNFLGNLAHNFSKVINTKAVAVEMNDGIATIDISLVLKPGFKVREVVPKVQQGVKEAIQNMTGITVSKVNVVVESVFFEKTQTGGAN